MEFNGRMVSTLVHQDSSSDIGNHIFFVYDDILVTAALMPEVSYEWFNELSFEKISVK